jgi:hypothetical protein
VSGQLLVVLLVLELEMCLLLSVSEFCYRWYAESDEIATESYSCIDQITTCWTKASHSHHYNSLDGIS